MEQAYKRGTVTLQTPQHPALLLLAILHFAFSFPKSWKMSGDIEMSMAESAFHRAAEEGRGAGVRAAGKDRGAARAALAEQLTRLRETSGADAQEED